MYTCGVIRSKSCGVKSIVKGLYAQKCCGVARCILWGYLSVALSGQVFFHSVWGLSVCMNCG